MAHRASLSRQVVIEQLLRDVEFIAVPLTAMLLLDLIKPSRLLLTLSSDV